MKPIQSQTGTGKVSASELMEIVTDTNKKVEQLVQHQGKTASGKASTSELMELTRETHASVQAVSTSVAAVAEQSASLTELLNLVKETKETVKAMTPKEETPAKDEPKSIAPTIFLALMAIVGCALITSVYVPAFSALFSMRVWTVIYTVFAAVVCFLVAVTRANRGVKAIAVLVSMAPMVITFITPLF